MGKRAASTSKPAAAKAKQVKLDPSEQLQQLLEKVCTEAGQPASVKEVLQAAIPHCISTPAAQRHEFQERMLSALGTIVAGLKDAKSSALEEAEKVLEEAQQAKQLADEEIARQQEEVDRAAEDRTVKDQERIHTEEAFQKESQAKAEKDAAVQDLEKDRESLLTQKSEYEQVLTHDFKELVEGSFPGNLWREKVKKIAEFVEVIKRIDPEPALGAALSVALKLKPADRPKGNLCEKTLEFTEELIKKHIDSLEQKLSSFQDEVEKRQNALAESERSAKDVEDQLARCMAELDDFTSILRTKESALKEAKKNVKQPEAAIRQAQSKLQSAKKALELAEGYVAQTDAFREGPTAPAEEEPAVAMEE